MEKLIAVTALAATLSACSGAAMNAGREALTTRDPAALSRYATEAAADAVIGQCVAHAFKPVGTPLAMNEALKARRSWVQVDCQALRPGS